MNEQVQLIQHAEQLGQSPNLPFTQTEIDPLIVARQGKTLGYVSAPMFNRSTQPSYKSPVDGGNADSPWQTGQQ
ncbi:MAG TPA: hypothetical protein VHZ51_20510 [Ktedonobacteraceae bacterium]|nr:hypothetical protein [Ktedonobacteraceae bacterium]